MKCFIDIREAESHLNGETGMTVNDQDGLDGCDVSLAFEEADVELVMTVGQIGTLHEAIGKWLHSIPGEETRRDKGPSDG